MEFLLLNCRMPNCTTVVQTASDLFELEENDTFRLFNRLKKLPKCFGIVQLIPSMSNLMFFRTQILIGVCTEETGQNLAIQYAVETLGKTPARYKNSSKLGPPKFQEQ